MNAKQIDHSGVYSVVRASWKETGFPHYYRSNIIIITTSDIPVAGSFCRYECPFAVL